MFYKLHKYIIKSFIGPWVITFLICIFLLLMQFLWRYVDDLVGKGLEWNIILEFLFYASLTLVPLSLPLSVLLATIMTYGNLGEKNELFAMKSGGISLYRIMYPLLVFVILISIADFYFSNNLLPYTNLKMRSLLFGIQQQRPEINIRNGIFTEPVEDLSIKIEHKNRNDNSLEGILVYDHRKQYGNFNVTTAQTGSIKITDDKSFLILKLNNGYRYEELSNNNSKKQKYPHQSFKFSEQIVYLPLDGLGLDRNNEELFKGGYEMLNNNQLIKATDSLNDGLTKRKADVCYTIKNYSLFKGLPNINMMSEEEKLLAKQKSNNYDTTISKLNYNIDSIYKSLSLSQKNKVIDFAINYARTTKTYIDVTRDELLGYQRYIMRYKTEWHRKYVLSIACILFYLIGAPIGAIIRKGGFGLPVIISVFIFLIYYVVSITFEKTVREMVISPALGMWFSTFVLIPIAVYLIVKSSNDSARLSPQFYLKIKNLTKKILPKTFFKPD